MCSRYTLMICEEDAELQALVAEAQRKGALCAGDVHPADLAPVLVAQQGQTAYMAPPPGGAACCYRGLGVQMAAHAMVWGYPNPRGKGLVFNTRAETAHEKPMWRDSLRYRRCLVPATGFYEWQQAGPGEKQPYLFTSMDGQTLYMAGIYKNFADENGRARAHFSILTSDANPDVKDVHARMPVVLPPAAWGAWLGGQGDALLAKAPALRRKAV